MNDITENKKVIKMIFEKLKQKNHIIEKEKFLDSYFIFDKDDDSVCHFHIKGCKGWKFGIWIFEKAKERESYIHFFAQYEKFIDKFKPSASTYCESITKDDFLEWENDNSFYSFNLISNMITEIKKHPILSFYKDVSYATYLPSNFNIVKMFIEVNLKDFLETILRNYTNASIVFYFDIKNFIMAKSKFIHEIEFIDRNKTGALCYPRYILNIVFKDNSTEEQQDKFIKFWNLEKHKKGIRVEYFIETDS
jgi:hypothetical protein